MDGHAIRKLVLDVSPEVSLWECPAGLFYAGQQLCVKIDAVTAKGFVMAYVVESGEFFWGDGRKVAEAQHEERVRPVEWRDSGSPE